MQRFEYGVALSAGDPETDGIPNEALLFNARPFAVPESYHTGALPQRQGLIEVKDDSVIMTAFKLCEDGSGDAVLRFYESAGRETHTFILCDMLNAGFFADFMPYEMKTFRIGKDGRATEVNFLEGIV